MMPGTSINNEFNAVTGAYWASEVVITISGSLGWLLPLFQVTFSGCVRVACHQPDLPGRVKGTTHRTARYRSRRACIYRIS